MKNKYNTLLQYILDNSNKDYNKETVNGLFRSILEPVFENPKSTPSVFIRILNLDERESLLKRLSFSSASVYSYSNVLDNFGLENVQAFDIWGETEFIVVVDSRYSAALLWDCSLSESVNSSPVCLFYNSKIISEIVKKIIKNSNIDIQLTTIPDRRENSILNKSVKLIADNLDEKNKEILFSELEKVQLIKNDDRLETAAIVAEKAKYIAHEIKNNLSIINLYSKIAQKRTENVRSDEENLTSLQQALVNISNASENISSQINDLRCLSSPFKSNISIKQLILNTVMQCNEKANQAGVKISIEEFDDRVVNTDKVKVQCALMNIIYNAIEACSDGCKIEIECLNENDIVSIFVKNNGDSIPDELKMKIFEPDFTTKEKGNGLGLAICKKQLELIGGNIELVKSDVSETIFKIVV